MHERKYSDALPFWPGNLSGVASVMSEASPAQNDKALVCCPYEDCEREMRLPRGQIGTVKCPHCLRQFSADTRVARGGRGNATIIPSKAKIDRTRTQAGNSVTRSWKQALMGGTGCIVFGGLTIYLFSNGHEIWALLTAFAAFGGVLMAVRGRQGKCPRCGTTLHFEDRSSPSSCTMCGRYSRIEQGRVKFVEPGFVAPSASFKVPFDAFLIEP